MKADLWCDDIIKCKCLFTDSFHVYDYLFIYQYMFVFIFLFINTAVRGPRYDCSGNVIPYSILGNVNDFMSEAEKHGHNETNV